jgi:hypothetical protein
VLELLAIVLLSVGSLPPLEPLVKQKPPEVVPADQAAASAAKAPVAPAKPQAPVKTELGPVAKPEIRSEGKVPDRLDVPEPQPTAPAPVPAAEPAKKPARAEKKPKKTQKAEKAEADGKEKKAPGDDAKEPGKGEAEAPSEDQQHAAAPSLAPGAICDELRRAARDRREDRIKLTQEREALGKERARLEALAEEIAQARASLKEETARLQAVIDKANDKAKGPAKPGAPLPAGKPAATGQGQSPSMADAGRK